MPLLVADHLVGKHQHSQFLLTIPRTKLSPRLCFLCSKTGMVYYFTSEMRTLLLNACLMWHALSWEYFVIVVFIDVIDMMHSHQSTCVVLLMLYKSFWLIDWWFVIHCNCENACQVWTCIWISWVKNSLVLHTVCCIKAASP